MDARWLGLISMRLHYFQAVAQKGSIRLGVVAEILIPVLKRVE